MRRVFIFIMMIIILLLVIFKITDKEPQVLENIRYSTVPVAVDSLFHIAYSEDMFKDLGLDVESRLNPDGKSSLEDLFENRADIIAVTATPIVYKSFERDDIYILADIKHTDIHKVIVRKSSGINSVEDLKGKKIAVMKGTSAEFFMDTFLSFNNIDPKHLDLVKSLNAPQKLDAFLKDEIDGFFCWEPFIAKAKKALGDDALILVNKDVFVGSWLIVAKKEFVDKEPQKVKGFLSALHKAEGFVKDDREASIKIYSQISGVDIEIAKKLFSPEGYSMKLDESLLNLLEDQAQWSIDYQYIDTGPIPNYLKMIYTQSLKEIDPDAVTIIGYQ